MNIFHRFEGKHIAGCVILKDDLTPKEYPRKWRWCFSGEGVTRDINGGRKGRTTDFVIGICNNPGCSARVLVRSDDLSAYIEEIPF